jgi:hypothetical protein
MVRFTLDVDGELHSRMKIYCVKQGKPMSDVLRAVWRSSSRRSRCRINGITPLRQYRITAPATALRRLTCRANQPAIDNDSTEE